MLEFDVTPLGQMMAFNTSGDGGDGNDTRHTSRN